MLSDIDEPTFPFGLSEVHINGSDVTESHQILPDDLNNRLRFQAKQMGVSLASLCHVAWAQVLARTSGQDRVVFGTVLLGGMQGEQEADQMMGLSINTLPIRCDMNGSTVRECVHQTHLRLAALLEHEYTSLSLAQRCSGVDSGTPLFSALLNYLHTSLPSHGDSDGINTEFVSQEEQVHYPGIELLGGRERTNYPFELTVEDFSIAIGLTIQALRPIDPIRVGNYMRQTLESLVKGLENSPNMPVLQLEPDMRVAICVERSFAMIIGILAILKAGGAYVPLDPAYASERLQDILRDSAPDVVVADKRGRSTLKLEALSSVKVVDPNTVLSTACEMK
ncbi:hypothetical protein BGZ65_010413, partial [Modicella reniformis]